MTQKEARSRHRVVPGGLYVHPAHQRQVLQATVSVNAPAGSQNTFALPFLRRQPARRTRDVVQTESGIRVFHGVHCCHGNQPAIPPQLESVARLHPAGATPKCQVSCLLRSLNKPCITCSLH